MSYHSVPMFQNGHALFTPMIESHSWVNFVTCVVQAGQAHWRPIIRHTKLNLQVGSLSLSSVPRYNAYSPVSPNGCSISDHADAGIDGSSV